MSAVGGYDDKDMNKVHRSDFLTLLCGRLSFIENKVRWQAIAVTMTGNFNVWDFLLGSLRHRMLKK
ncbi:hypothetical protein CI610_02379 [invertebrate metagenome]|uniref:Uncharacterized protein n=1 Tax=invertebrate metagenome TaxID=1711999 RepID=A0A2H9T625_9ZZZZ